MAASGVQTWVLDLPVHTPPLSSNVRSHWTERYREQQLFRSATRLAILQAKLPRLDRCDIVLQITPPRRARRDSDNYVANCLKPIKDGLVAAGLVDDDTDRFIRWRVELAEAEADRLGRWRYRLTITSLEPDA
jgi:hypothetical protein